MSHYHVILDGTPVGTFTEFAPADARHTFAVLLLVERGFECVSDTELDGISLMRFRLVKASFYARHISLVLHECNCPKSRRVLNARAERETS